MCLIIDANCAAITLCANPNEEFKPVLQAILRNNATVALGGSKQREEYMKMNSVWKFIAALEKAGKARLFSDAKIDALEVSLKNGGQLRSDDPHILALAKVSGTRLLCSRDQNLHHDFTSKKIIDNPRGSVYQNATHSRLLRKCGAH